MTLSVDGLLQGISKLPRDWHGAGSVSVKALRRIAEYSETLKPLRYSVETGSGKTTILLSHLSSQHLVFAMDGGHSISQVKKSELFNPQSTVFVEGPTQKTLPTYRFEHPIQVALIDGPHGYPFPDIEYFYFYPRIQRGGLLIIDDIQIPSIRRMFDIIKEDQMFDLKEVVDKNMAFFVRTDAPLIPPDADNWWLQGYNRHYYNGTRALSGRGIVGRLQRLTPEFVRPVVPGFLKRLLRRMD